MTDAEFIVVNGARMERSFFEENLSEAKSLVWMSASNIQKGDHHHCVVCTIPITQFSEAQAYRSGNRFLCEFYFKTYLKS